MRGTTTLSNVNTIEGDEKKNVLQVPKSRLVMPLIKLKSTLQGLDANASAASPPKALQGPSRQAANRRAVGVNAAAQQHAVMDRQKQELTQQLMQDVPLKKRVIQNSRNQLRNMPETVPTVAINLEEIEIKKDQQGSLSYRKKSRGNQPQLQICPNPMLRQTFCQFKDAQNFAKVKRPNKDVKIVSQELKKVSFASNYTNQENQQGNSNLTTAYSSFQKAPNSFLNASSRNTSLNNRLTCAKNKLKKSQQQGKVEPSQDPSSMTLNFAQSGSAKHQVKSNLKTHRNSTEPTSSIPTSSKIVYPKRFPIDESLAEIYVVTMTSGVVTPLPERKTVRFMSSSSSCYSQNESSSVLDSFVSHRHQHSNPYERQTVQTTAGSTKSTNDSPDIATRTGAVEKKDFGRSYQKNARENTFQQRRRSHSIHRESREEWMSESNKNFITAFRPYNNPK